jgi:hypothetical protein
MWICASTISMPFLPRKKSRRRLALSPHRDPSVPHARGAQQAAVDRRMQPGVREKKTCPSGLCQSKSTHRGFGGKIMKLVVSIAIAVSLACQVPAIAQTTTPAATIVVPDLPDEDFSAWTEKSNAYVDLLNGSLRAIDSLKRYRSWVDMKTGPTGDERYISYGLYSVSPEQATKIVAEARAAADGPPTIPPLDDAARRYAASFEALVPILNDAAAYYQRQDYKDDKMAGGQALHAKIVPAMAAFLAAREQLEGAEEELSAGLDRQGLALIERREGKTLHWQVRRLGMTAKAALRAMPAGKTDAEMAAFGAAIAAYADAVRDFDNFAKSAGHADQSGPRELLARFRTLREKVEKKDAGQADFSNVVGQYNAVVDLMNSYQ